MSLPPLEPFDPTLPLERAHTLPASWYTDPAVLAAERRSVFGRTWQVVGRSEQVARPGQFFTTDVAGEPILVVRGDDGTLRGFFNVCRHRAAPILSNESGCVGKLRCQYHGWTYDLVGRLKGTPEFEGVCDFAKDDHGLIPVGGVAELGSLVLVHLSSPNATVDSELSQFSDWCRERGAFEGLVWYARKTYDLACNWKVYVDNYLDGGYHVNTVHPALADAIDYREYRTDVFPLCSVQTTPLKAASGAVGSTRTGDAAYWWLFPNFMLNRSVGVLDTNLVLPIGPDRCRVLFDFYFAVGTDEGFKRDSIAVADQVQAEDVLICEQVQRGLGSSSYRTGRFSVKRENGGYAFHRLLANYLGQG